MIAFHKGPPHLPLLMGVSVLPDQALLEESSHCAQTTTILFLNVPFLYALSCYWFSSNTAELTSITTQPWETFKSQ